MTGLSDHESNAIAEFECALTALLILVSLSPIH